jgi:hypothetical protein
MFEGFIGCRQRFTGAAVPWRRFTGAAVMCGLSIQCSVSLCFLVHSDIKIYEQANTEGKSSFVGYQLSEGPLLQQILCRGRLCRLG